MAPEEETLPTEEIDHENVGTGVAPEAETPAVETPTEPTPETPAE